jgi:hypothetical protein
MLGNHKESLTLDRIQTLVILRSPGKINFDQAILRLLPKNM